MGIDPYLCRQCGGDIVGKGPTARVCTPCQKKRRSKTAKAWAAKNPRLEYFRQYYLDHKETKDARTRTYMRNMNPITRSERNRAWWKENAFAQKLKRSLGLKTIVEARSLINKGANREV